MKRYTGGGGFQTPSSKFSGARSLMSSVARSGTKTMSYPGDRPNVPGIMSSSSKRASSFFRSGAGTYNETRNLKDRDVQRGMQAKIIDFLVSNEFPYPNADKMVRATTRMDFARIFEFTYQQLDPRYSLRGCRIEDEMPRVFHLLGYPVPLKPSTMQTIGAAHTLHILLGAMTWLIDAVQMASCLNPQELLLASDDTDGSRTSLGYGYVVNAYKKMRASGTRWDDQQCFKEETENFIHIIEEKEDMSAMKADLFTKQKTVDEACASLLKEEDEMKKVQEELETVKSDLAKFQDYKRQLIDAAKAQENQKEMLNNELQVITTHVETVKSEIAQNEVAEANQKMSGDRARELRTRRTEIKTNMKQMAGELDNLEKSIYALQTDLFKEGTQLREVYSAMVQLYDEMRRSFDAAGDSFVIEMKEHSPNATEFFEFMDVIKEQIESLRTFVQKTLLDLDNDRSNLEREIEEMRAKKENKKADLNVLQRKIQQKEYEQALKREDWAEERGKAALKLDVAQNKVQGLKELQSNVLDSHEELAKAQKELQSLKFKMNSMSKEVVLQVTKKLGGAIQLCQCIREGRKALRQDAESLQTAFKNYIESTTSITEDPAS